MGQTYSAVQKQTVLCLLLPSFIDFLTLRGFDIIQKVLLAYLSIFYVFSNAETSRRKA